MSATETRPNVKDFEPDALRGRFERDGLPAYRADQIVAWIHARGVEDWDEMTDLGVDLRRELAERFETRALELETVQHSSDGTIKGTLRARDGAVLEAVVIPEEQRTTLCVSTQVGCPLACSFCATGAMGLARNLTTAEILDQLFRMREVLPKDRRITNIVFMGMGEPLLNLPNVVPAVRTLLHPKAFAMAPRRLTVSTAGVVPRIIDLVEQVPVNLAVSLHAATDEVRDVLVPINKRFPLAELLGVLRKLPRISRRHPVFFEYTLMEDVNDSLADARELLRILDGIPSKLNVIPMNPHPDAPYRPPSPEVASRFMGELVRGGMVCTLRRSRGADIDAACGQLAARDSRRDRGRARQGQPSGASPGRPKRP